jgi:hypothetical protein
VQGCGHASAGACSGLSRWAVLARATPFYRRDHDRASLPFLDSTIVNAALRTVSVTRRAQLAGVQRAGNDIATMFERFGGK